MYTYKICILRPEGDVYKLQMTDEEFESRESAKAFLENEDHDYKGLPLTILEVFEA